ncbi:DEAD/DEAH box helicase family protein [Bacillus sporothermodurans]|uniref:DEAD/DEAH box helicase family protein n=1 Tax=Heyndrickxia sporothermodurans TaxID=46224 RepID=A0AB37HJG8_9BACI|nr:DEAD/DEAH box helicase family protein [Heyndrickxia sporothermodurans]MBL5782258.1 DEAD/DEAH box helicase family protein [Heyndrickxia sporothermodurans]MBL5792981.1 DEAD/DEAH box helicase family protein [Heyndrickxia sporothermodurans]MBL5854037.1 DEAD/DEAH box helicase family protein [Heyndrickxia sporothermodurans]MBL5866720.1 DEAD/DEAH box helicase family protein [Heyndrickxia sporothermodurans]MBL7247472.1 DEAD/DEAH box helicase family protein [Heyndrickxia sporothermodurans]
MLIPQIKTIIRIERKVTLVDKKKLSERDICTKFITPAIEQSGWDIHRQVREEYTFTDGRVIVRGNLTSRGKKKRADYLLSYKPNLPIAIVEAKDNKHSIGSGLQQAINYGDILDVPFVYSSNGDGFIEHDMLTGKERELRLHEFPTPNELWKRYKDFHGINDKQEEIITEPYYFAEGDKTPRYYQRIAINRTVEAIARGQNRLLLVMATGTGKTYTAFQIIHRLWKSKQKKKVLFLADRNILVDQTMTNDFKPFGNVMTKIENRTMDSSYQIYLALYQQLSGNTDELEIFKQFSPDFFDLIVVDECHRGSAKEESRWRRVLEYFSSATQIGLTATPAETEKVSNIHYFGEPVYTYSLKQGITDGFLAPYKVIRIGLDRDLEGYRPTKGQVDKYGQLVEDREYYLTDFDKNLVLEQRTKLVAKKVTEFLKKTDRFAKTIIFCTDIDHAERMRQALVNENSDLVAKDPRYVMRITGDNPEGKAQLDNFIDEDSPFPTIVTTSKLLTTGVDCKTCKLIVLDSHIVSMTEFKQIVGRGTRLKPEYGKEYFTVMDFRNVSRLFADPEFDGEPVQIYDPEDGDDIVPPTLPDDGNGGDDDGENDGDSGESSSGRTKYYIQDASVKVINERVMYYDVDGKLITESLKDYSKKGILQEFATLDDFIKRWNSEEKKDAIIDELKEHGVLLDALKDEVGQDLDEFDLICHIAFDQKPLTRSERAKKAKKEDYLSKYSETARAVIEAILDKYQDEGRFDFDDVKVLKFKPFDQFGNSMKIAKEFGGKNQFIKAMKELEKNIYA